MPPSVLKSALLSASCTGAQLHKRGRLEAQLDVPHLLPHLTLPQTQPGCLLTPSGALPGSQGLCLQANSALLLRLWHSVGLAL